MPLTFQVADVETSTPPSVEYKTTEVPPNTVCVPVIINDNGNEFTTHFIAGHLVTVEGYTSDSVRPYLGWVICK